MMDPNVSFGSQIWGKTSRGWTGRNGDGLGVGVKVEQFKLNKNMFTFQSPMSGEMGRRPREVPPCPCPCPVSVPYERGDGAQGRTNSSTTAGRWFQSPMSGEMGRRSSYSLLSILIQ